MKRKGFTLVEILIALLILGLGIVTVFNLFPLALQSITYSRRLNEVYFLAQKKLEELGSSGFEGLPQKSGDEGQLHWEITSEPVTLEGNVEMKCVQLEVEFDFQQRKHTQRFVTYVEK